MNNYFITMCSIINGKINKDLINIVRSYLVKENLKTSIYSIEILRWYFLIKLKQRFPQKKYVKKYFKEYNCISFKINNLREIRDSDPIFDDIRINYFVCYDYGTSNIQFFI